jgi:nucleotide-binding universal stress UspA family protein
MMFRRLLVPLDGSRLAECVLPIVERSAKLFDCDVTLLHVIEKRAPTSIHGDTHLRDYAEAERYLADLVEQLEAAGLRVDSHVHEVPRGDVPRCIAEHARELNQDLIVLCSHGMGGMRRLVFGSNAEQVLTHGITPVMLIQPDERGVACPFGPERIVVLIEDSKGSSPALTIGEELANRARARLYLLAVVPTLASMSAEQAASGRLTPHTTRQLLEFTAEEKAFYLKEEVNRLMARDIMASGRVGRGGAAAVLVATAREIKADLVVIAARGVAGLSAFWADVITRKVAAAHPCTLLLVPLEAPVNGGG